CAAAAGVELREEDYPKYRALTFNKTRELFAERLEVFRGIQNLLTQLKGDGIPMLVTTNTVRHVADAAIVTVGRPCFVATLRGDGLPMLVTTNTVRHVADSDIDTVGRHFFVDTICGDEVTEGKPAPDMYLEAARRVGVDPADALVFEDSTTGMRAALAAGCHVIGLPEHDQVEIPEGAVGIDKLRGDKHLNGAKAADVYDWFARISG